MSARVIGVGAVLPEPGRVEVEREAPELARVRKQMSRSAWLAALAVADALGGSGADPRETGIFLAVGPSTGAMEDVLRILAASTEGGRLDVARFARRGVAACNPLLAFQLMNNFTLCHASILHGLQGPSGAFFGGIEHALAEGLRALEEVPWVLVGAADSTLHPVARRERGAGERASEGAIVLLLARDGRAVEVAEHTRARVAHARQRGLDLGVATPALAWLEALPDERSHRRPRSALRRQAVITGVGAVSAFGRGAERLRDGLLAGRPAVAEAGWLPGFPPVAAADVPLLDDVPSGVRERWTRLGWDRDRRVGLTVSAALEAWRAAGRPDGLGLSLALGLEAAWLEDFLPLVTPEGLDWSRDPRGESLNYRSPLDLPARALAEILPLAAPRLVHASACAGGTLALGHAAAWIEAGEADAVLCGGGDSMLNPLGLAGLQRLGVISPRGACRPFDLRRDGIVVGEGAACFVVEEEGAARRRGAPILARVVGWASGQDGWAATAPRPGGEPAERTMAAALAKAGVDPRDVDVVAAHGTGTPLNDEAEAEAIARLVPGARVASWKGAFGHTMAAAGALEIAAALGVLTSGVLPGTVGFERPDPRCPVRASGSAERVEARFVLKSSFGFGGQDGCVVLERGT